MSPYPLAGAGSGRAALLPLMGVPLAAFLWAKFEVEIEGKDGWAKRLPTWRLKKHFLLKVFLGGRPLTGFHLWAFTFVGFMFHFPLLWIRQWTWPLESYIIGSLLLFWVLEDFLWFMLNPFFGWRHYGKRRAEWHPRWFLGLPADHWGMLLLSFLLLAWSYAKI
jgi:hypothetical protein